jgi:hypothetical protein
MIVKDAKVFEILDKIKEHYKNNISNRYIRRALLTMELTQTAWDLLDSISEKAELYKVQGFQLDELYDRIIAASQFISHARKEVMPNLRVLLAGGVDARFTRSTGEVSSDRVLGEMAAKNFPVNLKIFADLVNELYLTTVEIDKGMHKNKKPIFERISELKNIGRYLVEGE